MEPQILVREMLPSEERAVRELFKRSLGFLDRLFFLLAFREALGGAAKDRGGCLVAVCDGAIVGSVSLRVMSYGAVRAGLIDAIVADRGFRGRGVGKSLLDAALQWLRGRGCEAVYATADRYNSPSWNMFVHKGFSPYELPWQLKELGFNLVRLWSSEFYFFAVGNFFLKRTDGEGGPREAAEMWHFLSAWLGLALVWWLLIVRAGGPAPLIPMALAVAGLSLSAHELGHKLAAARLGLRTTFKAWDSGLLFSSLLAVLFGAFFPAYGSTYARQIDWRYDPERNETGLTYTAGPAISLALAAAFLASLKFANDPLLDAAGRIGYATNLYLAVFNLLPIQGAGGFPWDGGKVFRWSRSAWLLLVTAVMALMLTDMLT